MTIRMVVVTSSYILLVWPTVRNPKHTKFTIIDDKEKQQIITLENVLMDYQNSDSFYVGQPID